MGYYGRKRYRNWRSRGWRGSSGPSKYSTLASLFGDAVFEIRRAFLNLDEDALSEMLEDYGAIYDESAKQYARKTFKKWKSGTTKLSGQTMERLIELVPPYLSPEQRFDILQKVLKHHKNSGTFASVQINVKDPSPGFAKLEETLKSMTHSDVLARLPESVMKAAAWLYDDDITASRAMLAQAERMENDLIRENAAREIALLRRTINSGQVKSASYYVEMPTGRISVVCLTPSNCFIATVCYGETAHETETLRAWRDSYLMKSEIGRRLIVFYYNHGERLSDIVERQPAIRTMIKIALSTFIRFIPDQHRRVIK